MKAKIPIRVTPPSKLEEVEVDFPIYRKQDMELDDCECVRYTRTQLSPNGKTFEEFSIKEVINSGGLIEYEIEAKGRYSTAPHPQSDPDYILGKGRYACSRKEFGDVVARMLKVVHEEMCSDASV